MQPLLVHCPQSTLTSNQSYAINLKMGKAISKRQLLIIETSSFGIHLQGLRLASSNFCFALFSLVVEFFEPRSRHFVANVRVQSYD